MRITHEIMTRDRAAQILETQNAKNRKLVQARVNMLAAIMTGKDGARWDARRPDVAGIGFNSLGELKNGQHQLTAFLRTGLNNIEIKVTYDAPDDMVWDVVPAMARTTSDQLTMLGRRHSEMAADIASRIARDMTPVDDNKTKILLPETKLRVYNAMATAVEYTADLFKSKPKGIARVPVMAVVALASYHEATHEIEHFVRVLLTGQQEEPERERAIILLRNQLLNQEINGIEDMEWKTFKAMKHFINKESVKYLKSRTSRGALIEIHKAYPVPDQNKIWA